ncbi:hypothetical protein JCM6882_000213 [Rhodosporidiobolus microsporus]
MADDQLRTPGDSLTTPPAPQTARSPLLYLAVLVPLLLLLSPFIWPTPPRTAPRPRTGHYHRTLMSPSAPRTLRFGSFNVRYDRASKHPLLQPVDAVVSAVSKRVGSNGAGEAEEGQGKKERWGEHRWHERREKLVDQVLFHELDVVGFQEVLDGQFEDLKVLMGEEEWGYVGVGRDDGKHAGEAVPIFFRHSRLSLLRTEHFWLSPTPHVPGSRGWDAGQPRMVTAAFLRDRLRPSGTGEGRDEADVVVLNTHWDDRGLLARTESAKLILKQVEALVLAPARERGGQDPLVVLLGDLNSVAEESGYQVLTGGRYKPRGEGKGEGRAFRDARHELAARGTRLEGPGAMSGRFGPLNTFTGFTPSDVPKVIDFIMLYSNTAFLPPNSPPPSSLAPAAVAAEKEEKSPQRGGARWKVSRYGVVPNFFEDIGGKRGAEEDGMLISDHRLVVVGVEEVVG